MKSTWARKQKLLTVASNLESGEPLWFGRERKKETLDEFFQDELSARQRRGIDAACVDMWEPYRQSIEQWALRLTVAQAAPCRLSWEKEGPMVHQMIEGAFRQTNLSNESGEYLAKREELRLAEIDLMKQR
ncbi:MAG: hypothetical protein DMG52_32695, partial [Acidobacteria bacterium]